MKINRKPEQFCAANERIKYKYRQHLRRIGQKDEKTILGNLKHIRDIELFVEFKGFECFNADVADKYIQGMFNAELSLSYITDNIRALKDFLNWLERQRGYRSKIDYNHIDYLNVSRNQRREAKAGLYQKSYSYEQIIAAIRNMPSDTDRAMRDKAMVSLQALCALRISELRTVKLQNLIEEDGAYFIHVSPKNMHVKFAKTRQVVFVPLPKDIIDNVIGWRDRLVKVGFKSNDPMFPTITRSFNERNLFDEKLKSDGIKSETTIRHIFKACFINAGFEYLNPHSFRKTIARYAQTQSPQFLNAVRQNLGHSSIDTTLSSYGQLSELDQRRVISEVLF
ncbi:MAG: site-specific integrase [Hyphomicrobiales bacterium]